MSDAFSLTDGFRAKQEHMLTGLGLMPNFTDHPTAKGDANEEKWRTVLRDFLPERYGVGAIFAIDSRGGQSDQIDIAIWDRQYSPLFFHQNEISFVPAESIYAVFEVKPDLNKANLEYAAEKIASVRKLHRTSASIAHAGGRYDPQDPDSKPILGGFLSTNNDWSDLQGEAAKESIQSTGIDLGIAVGSGAFDQDVTHGVLDFAPETEQLIWFALRLFRRLANLGTALALDLDQYYPPQA